MERKYKRLPDGWIWPIGGNSCSITLVAFSIKHQYGDFVGKAIFPIASTVLGLCFFIILSQKNSSLIFEAAEYLSIRKPFTDNIPDLIQVEGLPQKVLELEKEKNRKTYQLQADKRKVMQEEERLTYNLQGMQEAVYVKERTRTIEHTPTRTYEIGKKGLKMVNRTEEQAFTEKREFRRPNINIEVSNNNYLHL